MTRLTEFLLARIAEDEAGAALCIQWGVGVHDLAGWVEIGADSTDAAIALGERFSPARVLAECEAKRRVVEWSPEEDVLGDGWHDGWNHGHRYAMQLLALPYNSHPEYREEWKL